MNFLSFANCSALHSSGGNFLLPRFNSGIRAEMHCLLCNKTKPYSQFIRGKRMYQKWLTGTLEFFPIQFVCFQCSLKSGDFKTRRWLKHKYRRAYKSKTLKPKYSDYIQSDGWRRKKYELAPAENPRCECCSGTFLPIHGHHASYVNLGRELPSDLRFICAACHAAVHKKKRASYSIGALTRKIEKCLSRVGLTPMEADLLNPKEYAKFIVATFEVGHHLFLRGKL